MYADSLFYAIVKRLFFAVSCPRKPRAMLQYCLIASKHSTKHVDQAVMAQTGL